MNYYNTTSEENTIACRNNGDPDFRTSGKGEYTNKPPVIKVLCFVNDVMLRAVEMSTRTVYEIIYDGDIFSRSSNLREIETMYLDFADITRAKYNKIKAAA